MPARLWAARIALSVAVCALACFIWGNSLASGPASSQVSGTVTQRVNDALQAVSPGASVTEHFVRKAAHFSEFALLGALAAAWVRAWGLRLARALGWALLAGMAVALADETLQLFRPGARPARRTSGSTSRAFARARRWPRRSWPRRGGFKEGRRPTGCGSGR